MEEKLMKKLIALLLVLVMVIGLVACGAEEAAPKEEEKKEEAAPTEEKKEEKKEEPKEEAKEEEHAPVTLQVSIVETDFLDMWEDTIKPKFEEEYPWITLEAVGMDTNKADYHQQHAASKDLPPVMQTDANATYMAMVDEGLVLDLSDTEVAKHVPASYKSSYTTPDGKLFGITQGAAYGCAFYNMAILKEAGWEAVPTCWDEFIQMCEDVKAAGYDVLTFAGDKNTCNWMPFEAIIVNAIGEELGEGGYEDAVRHGTLVLNDYPVIAERMAALVPYVLAGTASSTEDDVTATMGEGNCAVAIAGNWTSTNIINAIKDSGAEAVMDLIRFNESGKPTWISATPESSFGKAAVEDEALAEARDIFFDWIFTPENFQYIQHARGTLPVFDNFPAEYVELGEEQKAFVAATGSGIPFSMNFNNVITEANTDIHADLKTLWSGNLDAKTACDNISGYWAKFPKIAG